MFGEEAGREDTEGQLREDVWLAPCTNTEAGTFLFHSVTSPGNSAQLDCRGNAYAKIPITIRFIETDPPPVHVSLSRPVVYVVQ